MRGCNNDSVKEWQLAQLMADRDNTFRNQSNNDAGASSWPRKTTQPVFESPQQTATVDKVDFGFEDYYFYFESQFNQSTDSTQLQWSIPDLNFGDELVGCIAVNITDFYFPNMLPQMPSYYFFRRIFMEFVNQPLRLAGQAANNSRFHFEFHVDEPQGVAVRLTPRWQTYFFRTPTTLSDFAIRFSVPSQTGELQRVNLPAHVLAATTYVAIPTEHQQLIITRPDTSILGPIGQQAAPGVLVILSGYSSGFPQVDEIVNGKHYIQTINDATHFTVPDIETDPVSTELPLVVTIPKNRIAFVARFTCLRNKITQRIAVNHL